MDLISMVIMILRVTLFREASIFILLFFHKLD